jgi:DNA adenine methylase
MIKSPLRYPGGKSKAISQILPLIPTYKEFREPFVGGGSVFVALKQKNWNQKSWINDLNYDLYLFWKYAQEDINSLVNAIKKIKTECKDGRGLFESYKGNWDTFSDFDRAVRFFVLNRITFSGTIDSGGYSEQAFHKRFTDSSVERLSDLNQLLSGVRITNLDFEPVINEPGEDVFLFLDPPYYSTTNSRLYGKKGDLHEGFDHERFAKVMQSTHHKWLITYDDCDEVRSLFSFAHILPWSLQYGMNNYGQDTAGIGSELFIANYPLQEINASTLL